MEYIYIRIHMTSIGGIAVLNGIWAGMILLGVVVAAFTGNLNAVTNAALESAQEAVMVCVKMLGIMSMWTGLMHVAEDAGVVRALSVKMRPFLRFLFPRLSMESKAAEAISTNFIANILGLGWAATPAGLKAMKELQAMNPDKQVASHEMCMFMIFNMSSLQLITVSLLAYRAQYNSANPSEIILPGLLATLVSSVAAVVFAKIKGGRRAS